MGSRPRFRSPCVTAPAHLLPYAPLYPLLPVLTHGAASYPPGLAALCRVPAVPRGLRLARSPLAIASRRPRSSPNPGYRLPARSAAPFLPAPDPPLPLHRVDSLLAVLSLPSSLLLPDGLSPSSPLRFLPASDPSPPPHRVGSPPSLFSLSSLLLPDGVAPSEPRSVRADGIPGSERHAAHRRASAGRGEESAA